MRCLTFIKGKGKGLPYFTNARPFTKVKGNGRYWNTKKEVNTFVFFSLVILCQNSPAHVMCAGLIF